MLRRVQCALGRQAFFKPHAKTDGAAEGAKPDSRKQDGHRSRAAHCGHFIVGNVDQHQLTREGALHRLAGGRWNGSVRAGNGSNGSGIHASVLQQLKKTLALSQAIIFLR